MGRTRLVLRDISQIIGSDGLAVVVLTDESKSQCITAVIEYAMALELNKRRNGVSGTELLLPEVLVSLLQMGKDQDYELLIHDVSDAQYKVTLICRHMMTARAIRFSDALLLSEITGVPISIDNDLFSRQGSPYTPDIEGVAIPINVVRLKQLKTALNKAIEDEDYELAAHLQKEIENRRKRRKTT